MLDVDVLYTYHHRLTGTQTLRKTGTKSYKIPSAKSFEDVLLSFRTEVKKHITNRFDRFDHSLQVMFAMSSHVDIFASLCVDGRPRIHQLHCPRLSNRPDTNRPPEL